MGNATLAPRRFEFETPLYNGRARQIRLVLITVEIAQELLNRNKRNRPLNVLTIARYAKEMRDGRFRSTAQPIVVDWKGDLLDGQHRLWAIVESGAAVEMYVATGEDPDTFPAYDRGRKRSAADALAIVGHKNRHCLAAAAAKLHRYERGVTWSTSAADRYVNIEEIVEAVDRYPGLADSVLIGGAVNARKLAPPALVAFLHYLFAEIDADAATHFFQSLADGDGLSKSDALYHLRRRLEANSQSKSKLPEKELAALIIKAWNARDKEVRTLRWRTDGPTAEQFPEIR